MMSASKNTHKTRCFAPSPPLTADEIRHLMLACGQHRYPERDRVLILLACVAGMRPTEIAAARRWWVQDDGLIGDVIHVQGRWRRDLPMPASVRTALLDYFRSVAGDADDPLICPERRDVDEHGRARGMKATSIQYWFWRLSTQTGIPITAKGARQGYIVGAGRRLRDAGANVGDLRQLAGIASVDHYLEGDAAAQKRLTEQIQKGLFGD